MYTRTLTLLFATLAGACSTREDATEPTITTGAIVPGNLAAVVEVLEYAVPTPDAAPRDVAVGKDGALWVSELNANRIGRLEPETGHFTESSLTTPGSQPTGIAMAPDGHMWFAASAQGYIGDLDPATGTVAERPLVDVRAKDPTAIAIAPDGTVWFTVKKGNFVGALHGLAGELVLRLLPRAGAEPDGIVIGKDGAPYVAELGTNHIARIDPMAMTVQELVLPPGARPHAVAVATDGMIYFTDVSRGRFGRIDPSTGFIDDWPSPGGPGSRPYAIAAAADGSVWYAESGSSPSTLVRFDPPTHGLSAMRIPSGCLATSLAATHDGRLYLACGNTNRVGIVRPRR